MWRLSDKSEEVCERIIETGLYKDILTHLSWVTAQSLDSGSARYLVTAELAVLHNVAWRQPTLARAAFRRNKVVDKVQKFRKVTKYPVIVLCVFSLITLCLPDNSVNEIRHVEHLATHNER